MPFIVDSVTMALAREGYTIDLVIHPVISVRRDADGRVVEVLPPGEAPPDADPGVGVARRGRARARPGAARAAS